MTLAGYECPLSSTLFIYASGRRWLLVVVVVRRCAVTVLASTTISSTVVLYTLQYNTERLPAIHQVTSVKVRGLFGDFSGLLKDQKTKKDQKGQKTNGLLNVMYPWLL